MKEKENFSLKEMTTFRIGGPAKRFVEVENAEEMRQVMTAGKYSGERLFLLGGGSNVLISDHGFDGTVIHLVNKGIEIVSETGSEVILKVASGELWDDVVKYAVENNFWGIENLSHIPGMTGGFAVQNVGAYGQEASQVVVSVQAFDLLENRETNIPAEECKFTYRKSIFNTTHKGRYVIMYTQLRLSKLPKPNLSYTDLQKRFEGKTPDQAAIRNAVIEIRNSKYPHPYGENAKGSAGSFFKNFVLDEKQYYDLEIIFNKNLPEHVQKLRDIKNKFPTTEGIKIPTAFLIEACGIKGLQIGGAKINPTQPLIILNETGSASSEDVLKLVKQVRETIEGKTGLHLLTEPELVGFNAEQLKYYGFNFEEIERYMK